MENLKLEPESFTSNSPLHDLQAIVLLEVLGLFRSPCAGVYKSAHFEAMYTSVGNSRFMVNSMILTNSSS